MIFILSVTGWLTNVSAWGAWTVVRDDDFARNDSIEGDLQAVYFADADHGWAVGFKGLILHTADGGESWVNQAIEMEVTIDFWSVFFLNEKVGFVVGTGGSIFMTKDGGNLWERKNVEGINRTRLIDMWLINEQSGFVVGTDNTLLKTTDGGANLTGDSDRVGLGETRNHLESIYFVSTTHG